MPYVLVETNDALGNKELLAAPEPWIQRHEDGTVYLFWPNVRNISMLNALLADERSTPLDAWETHECVIKCCNIQSLSVAGKMIKTLQNHWKTVGSAQKRTIEAIDDVTMGPACKKSTHTQNQSYNHGERQQVETISEYVHTEELLETGELQIIGMFKELRSLIEKRHDEARKKLHDGFYRVEKSLVSIVNDSLRIEQEAVPDSAPQCSQSANAVEFYVNPVTCIEEMSDFEERLNDEQYQKQVQDWIDCAIGYETHPEKRMRGILDSLFDRHFLSNCSWTGGSKGKLAFIEYKNIVNLFAYAGTTAVHNATHRYVGQFFIQTLQRAASRAIHKNMPPSIVTVDSTTSSNCENNAMLQSVESLNETALTDDGDSQNSDDCSNAEFCVGPFTCIEELDAFETRLDHAAYRAQMHKWTKELVAYEISPETRLIKILYTLFDRKFLSYFTWIGAKKGSYGMKSYKNVIQLFQYVGTTAAHRADYIFVENFFSKKLRYVSRNLEPS